MIQLPGDIDEITQLGEDARVVRNLLITQRYHDLSRALAETLSAGGGGDGVNVNWSTFATWASKTAGQSIRNEEVPPFVVDIVQDAEDRVMHPFGKIGAAIQEVVASTGFHASFLLAPIAETLSTVSSSISAGNLKVFRELAPQFVRFVETFRGDPSPTNEKLAAFIEPLDGHETTPDGPGQLPLREAFTAYVEAMRAPDAVARARFILLGNCLIGLHEQTRLQPQIEQAMDAPVDDILKKHLKASFGTRGGVIDHLWGDLARPIEHLVDVVEDLWERIATRFLMNLALPGGASLPLGRNIPREAAARSFLPAQLQNIIDPAALVKVLQTYDRARGASDLGSASVDWRVLLDRMNFIVNLFRSRQQDADLLGQPFSDDQREAIEARRVPDRALGRL